MQLYARDWLWLLNPGADESWLRLYVKSQSSIFNLASRPGKSICGAFLKDGLNRLSSSNTWTRVIVKKKSRWQRVFTFNLNFQSKLLKQGENVGKSVLFGLNSRICDVGCHFWAETHLKTWFSIALVTDSRLWHLNPGATLKSNNHMRTQTPQADSNPTSTLKPNHHTQIQYSRSDPTITFRSSNHTRTQQPP